MPTIPSLSEQRLLPRAERELFQTEIVRFHLEDLNMLAERWKARRVRRALAAHERARATAVVRAARWDRDGFLVGIRRYIDEGRAEGGDAFGPALLLLSLRADHARFLSGVAPGIRTAAEAVLAATGLDGPAPSRSRRKNARAARV